MSRATFPGAPSYGGVSTWVEGSQKRGDRTLAEASNLLGYNAQHIRLVNTDWCKKINEGGSRQ